MNAPTREQKLEKVLRSLITDIEEMKAEAPEDFKCLGDAEREAWFGYFETGCADALDGTAFKIQWPNLAIVAKDAREVLDEQPKPQPTLTLSEACDAFDAANDTLRGVENMEELEEMDSDYVDKEFPDMNEGQRGLILHMINLEYLRSIGKA